MAFIPWPNGVQLCFDFATAGQFWQFCLGLRKSAGAPTVQDLQDIADEGADWWTDALKNNITDDTTLRQVRATDMTQQGGAVRYNVIGTAGAIVGNPMPLGTPLVVSGRTEKRGRSYRGRTYVSGLNVAGLVNATDYTAQDTANIVAAFGVLQTALDGMGYDMVVVSKQHNGVVTSPAELNEVVAWIGDVHLDSQRRRLSGRGT